MPLKAGELSRLSDLQEGLRRVSTAYGKQGYIGLRTQYEPRLDAAPRATFEVKIEEGPQFRFGTLSFAGLPQEWVDRLTKEWRLKAGEVFDASYPTQFYIDAILPRQRQGTSAPRTESRLDEAQGTVHIKYVFGG